MELLISFEKKFNVTEDNLGYTYRGGGEKKLSNAEIQN
jgi:hypothetical protein